MAKAWARILALGIQSIFPVRSAARWRVDWVVFEDDDITAYEMDNNTISQDVVTDLLVHRMVTQYDHCDLVTVSPGRSDRFSRSRQERSEHVAIALADDPDATLGVTKAERPEHCFLVRTSSLANNHFVPPWYMPLGERVWKIINARRHDPAVDFTYRKAANTEPCDYNLWQTVFAEGEDFGLGYQSLRCLRLANVLTRDNRGNSTANTTRFPKPNFMVHLDWRSSVASRLLAEHPDTLQHIKDQCQERIAVYNPRQGCECNKPPKQDQACRWTRRSKCPCLALALHCGNSASANVAMTAKGKPLQNAQKIYTP